MNAIAVNRVRAENDRTKTPPSRTLIFSVASIETFAGRWTSQYNETNGIEKPTFWARSKVVRLIVEPHDKRIQLPGLSQLFGNLFSRLLRFCVADSHSVKGPIRRIVWHDAHRRKICRKPIAQIARILLH